MSVFRGVVRLHIRMPEEISYRVFRVSTLGVVTMVLGRFHCFWVLGPSGLGAKGTAQAAKP